MNEDHAHLINTIVVANCPGFLNYWDVIQLAFVNKFFWVALQKEISACFWMFQFQSYRVPCIYMYRPSESVYLRPFPWKFSDGHYKEPLAVRAYPDHYYRSHFNLLGYA